MRHRSVSPRPRHPYHLIYITLTVFALVYGLVIAPRLYTAPGAETATIEHQAQTTTPTFVAGAVRCNANGAWSVLADAGHDPLGGLRVLGAVNQRITVGYTTATKIHVMMFAPDETLGGKYHITSGPSAGLSYSHVYMSGDNGPIDPTPCTNAGPAGTTNFWAFGLVT